MSDERRESRVPAIRDKKEGTHDLPRGRRRTKTKAQVTKVLLLWVGSEKAKVHPNSKVS